MNEKTQKYERPNDEISFGKICYDTFQEYLRTLDLSKLKTSYMLIDPVQYMYDKKDKTTTKHLEKLKSFVYRYAKDSKKKTVKGVEYQMLKLNTPLNRLDAKTHPFKCPSTSIMFSGFYSTSSNAIHWAMISFLGFLGWFVYIPFTLWAMMQSVRFNQNIYTYHISQLIAKISGLKDYMYVNHGFNYYDGLMSLVVSVIFTPLTLITLPVMFIILVKLKNTKHYYGYTNSVYQTKEDKNIFDYYRHVIKWEREPDTSELCVGTLMRLLFNALAVDYYVKEVMKVKYIPITDTTKILSNTEIYDFPKEMDIDQTNFYKKINKSNNWLNYTRMPIYDLVWKHPFHHQLKYGVLQWLRYLRKK